jgi:hypothetical protein
MSADCHQTIWHYIPEDSSSEEVNTVERQRAEGHHGQGRENEEKENIKKDEVDEENKMTNHKYENIKKGSQYRLVSDLAMDWMSRKLRLNSQYGQRLFFSLLRSDQLQSPPSLSNRYEDLFLVG